MSRTKKLTFSALSAALCVVALALGAFVPRVTLAMSALAGIFPAVAVVACGYGWGIGASAAAALLGLLLLPDKTGALWFLLFFGHYPFWKLLAERLQTKLGKAWIGWCIKLAGFAACMLLLRALFRTAFAAALPSFLTGAGWIAAVLAALCVCFVLYDIAFSILIGYFRIRILPRFK